MLLYGDPGARSAPLRGEERLARGSQLRFLWETNRLVWRRRPDLVLFDHVGLAQAAVLPFCPLRRVPHAVFVHGGELVAAREGRRRRGLADAALVLANSAFTAGWVARAVPEAAEKVEVVPLCIDPERVERWRARASSAGPAREPAVLIVGRRVAHEPGKGHEELIAAWPRVVERVPGAELWIAGGGDDRARLEQCARDRGAGAAVRFLGRVSDEELEDLYRRAALFAMPSQQEGFGLVYAEAMWHGLPCIGSSADAAGQVIVHGETGRLVPYGEVAALAESLVSLLEDREEARRMGEAGTRRARESFTYPRFARDLLAALGVECPGSAAATDPA